MKISRQLQNEWTQKLKDSGFDDIEYPNGSLRKPHRPLPDEQTMANIREYYNAIERYIASGAISRITHVKALRLVAEGTPPLDVTKALKISRKTLYRALNRYHGWLRNGT